MKQRVQNVMYVRNPVYVFYCLGALVIYLLCRLFAARSDIGLLESAVFNVFYHLPTFLSPAAIFLYTLGSLAFVFLLGLLLLVKRRQDIALRVIVPAAGSYAFCKFFQQVVERGAPKELVENVVPRVSVTGFSFPSDHAAVAMAVGLTLALYTPRIYRRWVLMILVLVGSSGLFLGINLPLDVIAGWTIGFFCYSLASLALGSVHIPINPITLAQKLEQGGLNKVKLKPASVDARGSAPFFGEYEGGKIFVKVFNQDNNAADWLFKLFRRLRYRRLEDEVPSITPKRAIEHEAYLTMLAKHSAKGRVPEVLGIYKVGANAYAMAIKRIDATGLNKMDAKKITDKMLDKAWEQIVTLHKNRIIHKDLRCANVMIENKTGLPWIIDFGFSECAVEPKSFYKDNIEFVASSSTKIGAKRAVAAGLRALGTRGVKELIPYTQYEALSGATTTDLKATGNLLAEIREEMFRVTGPKSKQIKRAKLKRIGSNKFS